MQVYSQSVYGHAPPNRVGRCEMGTNLMDLMSRQGHEGLYQSQTITGVHQLSCRVSLVRRGPLCGAPMPS